MSLTDLAISGPLLVAFLLALAAGALSFASPYCLPLVPGYLGYLAGLVGAESPPTGSAEPARSDRWRVASADKTYMWTIKSRNDRETTHLTITNY